MSHSISFSKYILNIVQCFNSKKNNTLFSVSDSLDSAEIAVLKYKKRLLLVIMENWTGHFLK